MNQLAHSEPDLIFTEGKILTAFYKLLGQQNWMDCVAATKGESYNSIYCVMVKKIFLGGFVFGIGKKLCNLSSHRCNISEHVSSNQLHK